MKEGVLLFAIIAAVDVRDHKARGQKDHNYDAGDHDGRSGTFFDSCSTNNKCASGYYCDMYPLAPRCDFCLG